MTNLSLKNKPRFDSRDVLTRPTSLGLRLVQAGLASAIGFVVVEPTITVTSAPVRKGRVDHSQPSITVPLHPTHEVPGSRSWCEAWKVA